MIQIILNRLRQEYFLTYFLFRPQFYGILVKGLFLKFIEIFYYLFRNKNFVQPIIKKFQYWNRETIFAKKQNVKVQINPKNWGQLPQWELPEPIHCEPIFTAAPIHEAIFQQSFTDHEDLLAANRFIWLYSELLENNSLEKIQFLKKLILRWIELNPVSEKAIFEPYSISERLISWLFFMAFTQKKCAWEEKELEILTKSIEKQVIWLIDHLEYNGFLTNNHILNDARGLYIVGTLLGLGEVADLGKIILKTETEKVIRGGEMQEGSSHYQFLLSKNFAEMLLVAYAKEPDQAFRNWLEKTVSQMILSGKKLQSASENAPEYPLFGDISPDMPPVWFLGFPFSNTSKPSFWQQLFQFPVEKWDQKINYQFSRIYQKTGNWEVWINARTEKMRGHEHTDNGTLVIFWQGEPVVVDLGLGSYQFAEKDMQQLDFQGHNVPILDQKPHDFSKKSFLYYVNCYSKVRLKKQTENQIQYEIHYLTGQILERNLVFEENDLQITDRLLEGKNGTYQSYWHLDTPRFVLKSEEGLLISPFERSQRYGHHKKIQSFSVKGQITQSQPVEIRIEKA